MSNKDMKQFAREKRLKEANITYSDCDLYLVLCHHMILRYKGIIISEKENKKYCDPIYKEKLKFWEIFEQFLQNIKKLYLDQHYFLNWDENYDLIVNQLKYRSETSVKQNIKDIKRYKEMLSGFSKKNFSEIYNAMGLYNDMYNFMKEESKLLIDALDRYLDNALRYNMELLMLHKSKDNKLAESNTNSKPIKF